MKIDHLNFQQFHKLLSPANLMRVTAAYHSRLRRAWDAAGVKEFFLVGSAAFRFPEIKARYAPIVEWMQSDPPRIRLRQLADAETVPHIPGARMFYHRVYQHVYTGQGYGAEKYARMRAELELHHAKRCGIPGEVVLVDRDSLPHFDVMLETNQTGVDLLFNRSGLPLAEVVRFCWYRGCQPRVFFFWLPPEFEEKNGLDYFGGYKIHPAVKPVNSAEGRQHCADHNYYLHK